MLQTILDELSVHLAFDCQLGRDFGCKRQIDDRGDRSHHCHDIFSDEERISSRKQSCLYKLLLAVQLAEILVISPLLPCEQYMKNVMEIVTPLGIHAMSTQFLFANYPNIV
jgi:hypothetical protein